MKCELCEVEATTLFEWRKALLCRHCCYYRPAEKWIERIASHPLVRGSDKSVVKTVLAALDELHAKRVYLHELPKMLSFREGLLAVLDGKVCRLRGGECVRLVRFQRWFEVSYPHAGGWNRVNVNDFAEYEWSIAEDPQESPRKG